MNEIVGTFTIPEDLAHQLSDLLTKQTIRERLLDRMLQQGDMNAYEQAEQLLVPIVEQIERIKNRITIEYVPDEFKNSNYQWNYNGWEVDKDTIGVYAN